ncbi:hypothetical protein BHM03_00040639 [Ensete ventricosum]|nr:hypothetical protein BHM03_00040639 [Ensete ventricosum]
MIRHILARHSMTVTRPPQWSQLGTPKSDCHGVARHPQVSFDRDLGISTDKSSDATTREEKEAIVFHIIGCRRENPATKHLLNSRSLARSYRLILLRTRIGPSRVDPSATA